MLGTSSEYKTIKNIHTYMHCTCRLTLASSSSAIALECEPATDTSSAAAKLGPIQAHTARVRSTARSAGPRHACSGRGEGGNSHALTSRGSDDLTRCLRLYGRRGQAGGVPARRGGHQLEDGLAAGHRAGRGRCRGRVRGRGRRRRSRSHRYGTTQTDRHTDTKTHRIKRIATAYVRWLSHPSSAAL